MASQEYMKVTIPLHEGWSPYPRIPPSAFMDAREPGPLYETWTWEPTVEIYVLARTDFEGHHYSIRMEYQPEDRPETIYRRAGETHLSADQYRRIKEQVMHHALEYHSLPSEGCVLSPTFYPISDLARMVARFCRRYQISKDTLRNLMRWKQYLSGGMMDSGIYNDLFDMLIGGDRPVMRTYTYANNADNIDVGLINELIQNGSAIARVNSKHTLDMLLKDSSADRKAMKLIQTLLTEDELKQMLDEYKVTVRLNDIDYDVHIASAYNVMWREDNQAWKGCIQGKNVCLLDTFLATIIGLKTNPGMMFTTMNIKPIMTFAGYTQADLSRHLVEHAINNERRGMQAQAIRATFEASALYHAMMGGSMVDAQQEEVERYIISMRRHNPYRNTPSET